MVIGAAVLGPVAVAGLLLSFFALFDGITVARMTTFAAGGGIATACTLAFDGMTRRASE